jgi:hypothetical protein
MVGANDIEFYKKDNTARQPQDSSKTGDRAPSPTNVNGSSSTDAPGAHPPRPDEPKASDDDVPMRDAESPGKTKTPPQQDEPMETDTKQASGKPPNETTAANNAPKDDAGNGIPNGDTGRHTNGGQPTNETASQSRNKASRPSSEDVQMQDGAEETNKASHQNLEDKQAAEASYIHPMFLPPPNAKLDRNLGLPDNEAEDIRRLLALYVQKQEEVCRGAARLHLGLLKAERLRKDVLHWSKAEAHCGPNRDMSDGEDWYDKEEWGLTEDLKKGQDEEEEDTTTQGKKTRNRR